jgi:hypothetical protein
MVTRLCFTIQVFAATLHAVGSKGLRAKGPGETKTQIVGADAGLVETARG